MSDLTDWIQQELDLRGWTQNELARRARIGKVTISRILNEERNAGPDVCTAVARAFGVSADDVFRIAGLLPPSVAPEQLTGLDLEIHREIEDMDDTFKRALLETARSWKSAYQKKRHS